MQFLCSFLFACPVLDPRTAIFFLFSTEKKSRSIKTLINNNTALHQKKTFAFVSYKNTQSRGDSETSTHCHWRAIFFHNYFSFNFFALSLHPLFFFSGWKSVKTQTIFHSSLLFWFLIFVHYEIHSAAAAAAAAASNTRVICHNNSHKKLLKNKNGHFFHKKSPSEKKTTIIHFTVLLFLPFFGIIIYKLYNNHGAM